MLQKQAEDETKERIKHVLAIAAPTFAAANLINYAVGGRKAWTWLTANGIAAATTAGLSLADVKHEDTSKITSEEPKPLLFEGDNSGVTIEKKADDLRFADERTKKTFDAMNKAFETTKKNVTAKPNVITTKGGNKINEVEGNGMGWIPFYGIPTVAAGLGYGTSVIESRVRLPRASQRLMNALDAGLPFGADGDMPSVFKLVSNLNTVRDLKARAKAGDVAAKEGLELRRLNKDVNLLKRHMPFSESNDTFNNYAVAYKEHTDAVEAFNKLKEAKTSNNTSAYIPDGFIPQSGGMTDISAAKAKVSSSQSALENAKENVKKVLADSNNSRIKDKGKLKRTPPINLKTGAATFKHILGALTALGITGAINIGTNAIMKNNQEDEYYSRYDAAVEAAKKARNYNNNNK